MTNPTNDHEEVFCNFFGKSPWKFQGVTRKTVVWFASMVLLLLWNPNDIPDTSCLPNQKDLYLSTSKLSDGYLTALLWAPFSSRNEALPFRLTTASPGSKKSNININSSKFFTNQICLWKNLQVGLAMIRLNFFPNAVLWWDWNLEVVATATVICITGLDAASAEEMFWCFDVYHPLKTNEHSRMQRDHF